MGRRTSDERGSLAVGMGILMIITMMSVALVVRSTGNLNSVRRTQDFSTSLAAADGGMADFLFALDQAPSDSTLANEGTLGAGTFKWAGNKITNNEWKVQAVGTVNGVSHAIEARVTRQSEYPYAIFTEQNLTLNGNGGLDIYSYNSTTGVDHTGNAVLGSNRALTVNGGGGGNRQDYYTPNGSCSGCPNPQRQNGPRTLTVPTLPAGATQSCPIGGIFPAVINGNSGAAFDCTSSDISFYQAGATSVINPPAIIYVGANKTVSIAKAAINLSGKGKDFRILKAGTGAFTVGSGINAGRVNGIIDAPQTDLTIDGGHLGIDGSLTLNKLTVNGNPNFTMAYDDSIMDIVSGDWRVKDWQEIPVSSVTLLTP